VVQRMMTGAFMVVCVVVDLFTIHFSIPRSRVYAPTCGKVTATIGIPMSAVARIVSPASIPKPPL